MIATYLQIVQSNLADGVPKAVMLMMVNRLRDTVYENLVKGVYKMSDDDVDAMLAESASIKAARDRCRTMIKALKEAEEAVGEVYNLDVSQD